MNEPTIHVFAHVEVQSAVGQCPKCGGDVDAEEATHIAGGTRKLFCPHCEVVLWTYKVVLIARGE